MTSPQNLRLAPWWWAGGALLVIVVIYASLKPPSAPHLVFASDKVKHFAAYCGVAFWFAGMTERRRYPMLALALVLLGVAMELGQAAMGLGRTAEWRDLLANTLGIGTALAVACAGLDSWMLQIERRLGLS
jgi:VanZ family protein